MNRITAVVAGLLLAFVGTSESFADSNFHYVGLWGDDTNGDGSQTTPWRTIKHAISQCNNADYICLMDSAPDAYHESDIRILDKKVYIQSCNGDRDQVIIDGGGHHRVFYIHGSATNGTSIRDLTIRNGHTWTDGDGAEWNGGGIWCNSDIIVSNCKIMDCHAYQSGGGIYTHESSPTISGCTIEGNIAYGDAGVVGGGGGISCYNESHPTITGCTITGNTAGHGPIAGVPLGGVGGGIACFDWSFPTITNSNVTGNTAHSRGSGIYCETLQHPPDRFAFISGGEFCNNTPPTLAGNNNQIYGPCIPDPHHHPSIWAHCTQFAGDLDNDGDVDTDDLNALHAAAGICQSDVNHDGVTDINDILEVIAGWNSVCP